MTRRAAPSQAALARAIRAAEACGKVAVLRPDGAIVFAPPEVVVQPQPPADPFDLVDMSR